MARLCVRVGVRLCVRLGVRLCVRVSGNLGDEVGDPRKDEGERSLHGEMVVPVVEPGAAGEVTLPLSTVVSVDYYSLRQHVASGSVPCLHTPFNPMCSPPELLEDERGGEAGGEADDDGPSENLHEEQARVEDGALMTSKVSSEVAKRPFVSRKQQVASRRKNVGRRT